MQDRAIVQLGKLQLERLKDKQPYELFIQNMFPRKLNYPVVTAVFRIASDGDKFTAAFDKIDIETANADNYLKFGYRKGTSSGGDITFTTKFGDIDKKFPKILSQLKEMVEQLRTSNDAREYRIFESLDRFFHLPGNKELAQGKLQAVFETLDKEEKQGSGLTLQLVVDGEEKALTDFRIIQNVLLESGTGKSEKYGIVSEGRDQRCSICLETKEKLHGFASPFKYATVDKPGMVSGFFNQKNNWKNYPICPDCNLQFEWGQTYIANHLSGLFYGNFYYAIPKALISKDLKALEKATLKIREIYDELNKNAGLIKRREDYVWEMFSKLDDYFSLNLLFYEENPTTKAIKIKALLEEIVPSRFRKLFVEAPEAVNAAAIYQGALTVKKEKQDLTFSFRLIKDFFGDYFLDVVQKIFALQKISADAVYGAVMDVVRINYNRIQGNATGFIEFPSTTVLKAHLLIAYFQRLNIIDYQPNFKINMEKTEAASTEKQKSGFDAERIEAFVRDNPGFLDSEAKVGVFMLGALVRHLLNVQYMELNGGTPFEKKLRGYYLNPSHLQAIYHEAFGKLTQYDAVPKTLMKYVNDHFVLNIHRVSKMSNDEASFYFVAGTQFSDKLKFPKPEIVKN